MVLRIKSNSAGGVAVLRRLLLKGGNHVLQRVLDHAAHQQVNYTNLLQQGKQIKVAALKMQIGVRHVIRHIPSRLAVSFTNTIAQRSFTQHEQVICSKPASSANPW